MDLIMPREISLAVVGAAFDNKSGPKRIFEIEMCVPGEPVDLRPEPKNPADPNAVAVFSVRGVQIGYIRAERAPMIRLAMSRAEVIAIFQRPAPWGAIIRASLDGASPILPPERVKDWTDSPRDGEAGETWWPDYIPPDE